MLSLIYRKELIVNLGLDYYSHTKNRHNSLLKSVCFFIEEDFTLSLPLLYFKLKIPNYSKTQTIPNQIQNSNIKSFFL